MIKIDLDREYTSSSFCCGYSPAEAAAFVADSEARLREMGIEITETTPTSVEFRTTFREALEKGMARAGVANSLVGLLSIEHARALNTGELNYFELERAVYAACGTEPDYSFD